MKEDYCNIWYPLEEFPNSQYEINKLGEVRNKRTGQKLKGTVSKEGYLAYLFTIEEKSYRRFAHIIVAKQFIPNPNGYPIVNHKDENKLNPCVDNLEWLTYAQNSSHGTAQSRSESRRSKPINEYDLDGTFLRTWKSAKEIYLYHKLPYDREHRPTYLIKILTNNDDPTNAKIAFAGSVFLRYAGNTNDLSFELKEPTNLRNDIYKNLKKAKNVPSKYLINPEELNNNATEVIKEMIANNQFLFSPVQINALKFALKCIEETQGTTIEDDD